LKKEKKTSPSLKRFEGKVVSNVVFTLRWIGDGKGPVSHSYKFFKKIVYPFPVLLFFCFLFLLT